MSQLINNMMDIVHEKSLPTVELLQKSFPDNKDFMINVSTLFDPRYVFLIYAPLLFAINKRVGHRMIIALTCAEWANQILKWLLAGERPYWYVHERANELASERLAAHNSSAAGAAAADTPLLHLAQTDHMRLKQFPVTCELGAGSPSGHSMVTATVWYILIDAYLRGELDLFKRADYTTTAAAAATTKSQPATANMVAKMSWSIYTLMLVLVSLSRVYLACHFPHQCLAGALLGCLLARLVAERAPMEHLHARHFCLATAFMFASALATYAALRLSGFNPLWSVDKAMRWCAKKEYIHLDTTPFFSMMRYLGFCLGAGLAYDARKLASPTSASSPQAAAGHLLATRRLIGALLAIGFGQLLLALPMPKTDLNTFYAISFVMYTLFSYALAGPIPELSKRLLPSTSLRRHAKSA